MKALFFIEIPAQCPTEEYFYPWYKKELTGECDGSSPLDEIKNISLNCDVILVLPGFNVTLKKTTSKLKNRKKLEQAIAYELEEQFSEDIENLFFAFHNNKEKNSFDVAVINRVWFEEWLQFFKQQNILLAAAISDSMLLDIMPQEYLLLEKESYYLLKTPALKQVIDAENISYILAKLKENLPEELLIFRNTAQEFEVPIGVRFKQLRSEDCVLKLITEHYSLNDSFNLLQGIYKAKIRNDWQKIKWVAMGLFVLLFSATAFQSYQHWQLTLQESKLDSQRKKILQDNFPKITKMPNPLKQMKNELDKLKNNQQQQGQFVSLLAKVSMALNEMIAQKKIQLVGMTFSENELRVKLNANSMALINEVNNSLTAQQLKVEIESSDKSENQVNTSFKITGKIQ